MGSWRKHLAAMQRSPVGHTCHEAETVLKALGFVLVSKGGSHRWWLHEDRHVRVGVIGGRRDLKPGYIRTMLKTLDAAGLIPPEDENDD